MNILFKLLRFDALKENISLWETFVFVYSTVSRK